MRSSASWDSELCAGAALRLAGYRPAEAWVRAGGTVEAIRNAECVIRNWGTGAGLCGLAVLLRRFAFDHACLFFLVRQKRSGLRCVTFLFPRGSKSPFVRSHDIVRLSRFAGSLWVCAFLYGDSDGVRRDAGLRGTESAARQSAFCATVLALLWFPRGVRWGCAPQTAPRRPVSLDSLHWIRGHVRVTRRGACALYAAQIALSET